MARHAWYDTNREVDGERLRRSEGRVCMLEGVRMRTLKR